MKLTLLFALLSLSSLAQEPLIYSIFFEHDSSDPILHYSKKTSDIELIAVNSRIVKLTSYCDTTGSKAYNLDLAARRMEAVKNVLENGAFSTEKATIEIIGEPETISGNQTLASLRRVDIYYIEPVIRTEIKAPPAIKTESQEPISRNEPYYKVSEPDPILSTVEFSKKTIKDFVTSSEKEMAMDMNILFVNASDRILSESEGMLKDLLEVLEKYPELNAEIHGHVCCTDNYDMSVARALVVYKYLLKNDISKDRISYEGHSNTLPKVSPEMSNEDRKLNRRVTIILKKTDE